MPLRFLALAAGVLIVSTAALLIRFAIDAGAGPLAVAAGRLTLAAAVVVPLAMWRRGPELRRLQRRDWGVAAVAGGFLSLHFLISDEAQRHGAGVPVPGWRGRLHEAAEARCDADQSDG